MAEAFDPYYIWLAIPPEDQPPNYYRLLGVKTFETNVDVLESAADQRMSHLRSFQTGKHAAESQKLLNELAAARLCLLSPDKRQAYDRELKAKLAADKPPKTPSRPAVAKPLAAQPLVIARPLAAKAPAPAPGSIDALGFDPFAESTARRTPKKRPSKQSPAIYAIAGLGLLAVIAIAWIAIGGADDDDQPIAARDSKTPRADKSSGLDRKDDLSPNASARASQKNEGARATSRDNSKASDRTSADDADEPRESVDDDRDADDMALVLPEASPDAAANDTPEMPVDDQPIRGQADDVIRSVTADKLVLWNCHNNICKDRGTLSCNVELRKADEVVWSKKAIPLAWEENEEPATTIPLPNIVFDVLRVEAVTYQGLGPAISEIEVFRGDNNVARAKPVTASGFHREAPLPPGVVDGIKNSSQLGVGYWIAPDHELAWIDVYVAAPTVASGKNPYLSDLTPIETRVRPSTALSHLYPVAGVTSQHGIFLHPFSGDSSHVAFLLDKKYGALSGAAAICDTAGVKLATPLTFRVVADGIEVWRATMQKAGAEQAVNVSVGGVSKLELFVDCPGNSDYAHAQWVDLKLTRAGAAANPPKSPADKPHEKPATRKTGSPVTADKVVLWNCKNHRWSNAGTLSCNIELRKAGKVVWSKKDVSLAWSDDDEPPTTIPLPKIAFEALRVEAVTIHGSGTALCEVEVFRGDNNIALGKPATVSASFDSRFPATAVVDGVKDSSREGVGYWLGPNRSLEWVEVQVAPSSAPLRKTIYLSELPAIETRIIGGSSLSDRQPVAGVKSAHSLFTHPDSNSSSHVAFQLEKNYRMLSGAAALLDRVQRSATPLTFRAVGDGKELWRETIQESGTKHPLNLSVAGVSKLELFVDCPGSADQAHAMWVDLQLTRAGTAVNLPKSPADQPRQRTTTSNGDGGVTADKLVVWNCHNNRFKNHGMLSCNIELRKAGEVVWSKQAVDLAWSKDEEPSTTIRLPKIPFDAVRIETVTYEGGGPALSEIEVFRGKTNIARGKPATASGSYTGEYPPSAVVDGVRDSSQQFHGYWIAPAQQLAWVEVQVVPPAESTKPREEKPRPKVDPSQSGKANDSVVADKLVIWNCNNNRRKDRGMLTANVELRKAGAVVWSKKAVPLAWSETEEPATTILLPKASFDCVRVETVAYQGKSPALCEIEVFQGGTNIARGRSVRASAALSAPFFSPAAIVDGITNSERDSVGYWTAPDEHLAWIEVQVAQPNAEGNDVTITKAVYGLGPKQVDVTEQLQTAISSGGYVTIQADPRVFGDPAPFASKRLVVSGTVGTNPFSLDLDESQLAPLPNFPAEGTKVTGASNRFAVVAAMYGAGSTWKDLTAAVAKAVSDPKAPFDPNVFTRDLPDPWFGIDKHVVVRFDHRGLRYVRTFGPSESRPLLP